MEEEVINPEQILTDLKKSRKQSLEDIWFDPLKIYWYKYKIFLATIPLYLFAVAGVGFVYYKTHCFVYDHHPSWYGNHAPFWLEKNKTKEPSVTPTSTPVVDEVILNYYKDE